MSNEQLGLNPRTDKDGNDIPYSVAEREAAEKKWEDNRNKSGKI